MPGSNPGPEYRPTSFDGLSVRLSSFFTVYRPRNCIAFKVSFEIDNERKETAEVGMRIGVVFAFLLYPNTSQYLGYCLRFNRDFKVALPSTAQPCISSQSEK